MSLAFGCAFKAVYFYSNAGETSPLNPDSVSLRVLKTVKITNKFYEFR